MESECTRPELNDLLGAYVAGRLSAGETEAFELHLLGCSQCRAEVRTAAAVRASRPRWKAMRSLKYAPVAAIAASVVLLVTAVLQANPYRDLAGIEAPAFTGIPTRSEAALAGVDSAMAAYRRSDFRRAYNLLRAHPVDQPGAHFFTGVTALLVGDARAALEPLARATEPPGSAYADEARYYRAKAFLRLERPDSALAQLQAIHDTAPLAATARVLAGEIRSRR